MAYAQACGVGNLYVCSTSANLCSRALDIEGHVCWDSASNDRGIHRGRDRHCLSNSGFWGASGSVHGAVCGVGVVLTALEAARMRRTRRGVNRAEPHRVSFVSPRTGGKKSSISLAATARESKTGAAESVSSVDTEGIPAVLDMPPAGQLADEQQGQQQNLLEAWEQFYLRDEEKCKNKVEIDVLGDKRLMKVIVTPSPRASRGMLPNVDDEVSIHYVAKFENGVVFDSTHDQGYPLHFDAGSGTDRTILGLDHAVRSMSKGEKSVFTMSPDLAYGEGGLAEKSVPSNATLIYEVEFLNVIDDMQREDGYEDFGENFGDDYDGFEEDAPASINTDIGVAGEDPGGKYRWEPNGRDMLVNAPIPKGTKTKQISCTLNKKRIYIAVDGEVILDGVPGVSVDEEESFWEIDEGKDGKTMLVLSLRKIDDDARWPQALLK